MYANIPGPKVPFCSGYWYAHCTCFSYLATSNLPLVIGKHDLCAYHTVWYMLSLEILLVDYLSTVMCNECLLPLVPLSDTQEVILTEIFSKTKNWILQRIIFIQNNWVMFWLRDDQAKGMYRRINISVIFVASFPMTITYSYENVICNVTVLKNWRLCQMSMLFISGHRVWVEHTNDGMVQIRPSQAKRSCSGVYAS